MQKQASFAKQPSFTQQLSCGLLFLNTVIIVVDDNFGGIVNSSRI
jgi:hypothetical protein